MWIRCRGLGKSVPGKLALMGLAAAHGQITERKYSVARMNNKVIDSIGSCWILQGT
jgi:hypothetical protein